MQNRLFTPVAAFIAACGFAVPALAQVTCVPKPAGGYDCTGSVGNAPLAWPSTAGPGQVTPLPSSGGATTPLMQNSPTPPAVTIYGGDAGRGGNALPQNLPPPRQAPQPAGPLGGSSFGVVRPVPGGGFATYDIPSGQVGGAVPTGDGGYFYYRP